MLECYNMSKLKFPKVSVIIPNWNGKRLLKICLPSLLKQTFKDFEILVVDNGSVDGSSQYVKKNFPKIKVIELKGNGGFAHAANMGIKICTGEYMILINNDTKLGRRCLEYLVKAADFHKKVGMVACKMLKFYQPSLIDSAGAFINSAGQADNIGRGEKDGSSFDNDGPIFFVTGGGGLFKREVFEKVGFFDESFFAYYEDIDFCFRAQMKGFKGWYEPRAVIYHIHQATARKNPARLQYLLFRNMMQTIIKDFPVELLKKDWNFLKIILINLNTFRYLMFKGFLISALKAEFYIFLKLPKLLKKRAEIQNTIEVPISYILENIRPKKLI